MSTPFIRRSPDLQARKRVGELLDINHDTLRGWIDRKTETLAGVRGAVGAGFKISEVDVGHDSQVTVNLVDAVLQQPRVVGINTGSTNFKRDILLYAGLISTDGSSWMPWCGPR